METNSLTETILPGTSPGKDVDPCTPESGRDVIVDERMTGLVEATLQSQSLSNEVLVASQGNLFEDSDNADISGNAEKAKDDVVKVEESITTPVEAKVEKEGSFGGDTTETISSKVESPVKSERDKKSSATKSTTPTDCDSAISGHSHCTNIQEATRWDSESTRKRLHLNLRSTAEERCEKTMEAQASKLEDAGMQDLGREQLVTKQCALPKQPFITQTSGISRQDKMSPQRVSSKP